jgi:hypothetical protein
LTTFIDHRHTALHSPSHRLQLFPAAFDRIRQESSVVLQTKSNSAIGRDGKTAAATKQAGSGSITCLDQDVATQGPGTNRPSWASSHAKKVLDDIPSDRKT